MKIDRPSRVTFVLLAAALTACAHAPRAAGGRPAWIDGESARWPRSQFVLGVGSADDDNGAADRARGEVARVFSATISVESTVDESETNAGRNGQQVHSFSQTVAQKVKTATQKALEGVDVVARWKDPATLRCYALAALPKDSALMEVMSKMKDIDAEAETYDSQLRTATDRFERAKAAAKLVALLKSRAELESEARVLGGGGDSFGVDAGAARAAAAKALAALDVTVSVSGDGAGDVVTGVISGLNAVGLSAKSGTPDDKGDLTAQSVVNVSPVEVGPRWQRTRASASVSLADGRDGKIFAQFDVSSREDALDAGESRHRALVELAKKTSEKVTSSINDFFANQ
jgi:hypothetical protein